MRNRSKLATQMMKPLYGEMKKWTRPKDKRLPRSKGFVFFVVLCAIIVPCTLILSGAFVGSNKSNAYSSDGPHNDHGNDIRIGKGNGKSNGNGMISNSSKKSFSEMLSFRAELKNHNTSLRKWKMIDFQDDSNPHGFKCDWARFEPSTSKGKNAAAGKNIEMCVHSFPDIVSDDIKSHHQWRECNILPHFWEQSMIGHSHRGADHSEELSTISSNPTPIYLEIGANIGSCVMEMLFSTDAPIIAFEPNPKNWFTLRETMRRLDKSYQDRLVLLPIALGSAPSKNKIYSASNNMGNSQVGTAIKDVGWEGQKFLVEDQFEIQIERLEDVLELLVGPDLDIPLVKLDAQGFECEILKGMGRNVADKIRHVHFEKEDLFLKAHNCVDLLERFHDYGFDIYKNNKVLIDPSAYRKNMATANLDAKRPHDMGENVLVKVQA